jgi:hypothetical protein
MATRTSTKSGDWSSAGTWDSGVPADGDDVVIASGHTVTFDVDQSAFSTGVKITITGTLTHTTAAGSYCLYIKTGASVVGAGTWNVGTSATPIPFSSKHLITGAAGWYVDGNDGLSLNVYGAEPEYKYIKLSDAEAAGQTELSVDTDVTGDIWAAGDLITICNINKGRNAEERTIAAAGITSTTITVTSGLTGAKLKGSVICLLTRNIRFVATGTPTRTIYRVGTSANKLNVGGGLFYGINKWFFDSCNFSNFTGGVLANNGLGFYNSRENSFTGVVFTNNSTYGISGVIRSTQTNCIYAGNDTASNLTHSNTITGGKFFGNANGVYSAQLDNIYDCEFVGNYYAIRGPVGGTINNCSITAGQTAIVGSTGYWATNLTMNNPGNELQGCAGTFYNCLFTNATEHYDYAGANSNLITENCQSFDHDQVAGAFKAWMVGGTVTYQTGTKPTGYDGSYQLALANANYHDFCHFCITVPAGGKLDIEVQLRKSASMTFKPKAVLVNSKESPLAGVTPVKSFTMTDSVDTWEKDTWSLDNSGSAFNKEYTIWFIAQNANGSAYGAYKLITASGGGLLTNPGMTGGIRG